MYIKFLHSLISLWKPTPYGMITSVCLCEFFTITAHKQSNFYVLVTTKRVWNILKSLKFFIKVFKNSWNYEKNYKSLKCPIPCPVESRLSYIWSLSTPTDIPCVQGSRVRYAWNDLCRKSTSKHIHRTILPSTVESRLSCTPSLSTPTDIRCVQGSRVTYAWNDLCRKSTSKHVHLSILPRTVESRLSCTPSLSNPYRYLLCTRVQGDIRLKWPM